MKSKISNLISIVIVNKNDWGIERTLKLLSEQSTPLKFEVIVVDASSGSLDSIYSKFKTVQLIPYVNKTAKKITIAEQRNIGVKASAGNIVVFIDANCEPTQDWLTQVTKPILQGKESIVAGGVLSEGRRTFHDKTYYESSKPRYIPQAPTINLAIKKSVFDSVGLFDENLIHGEDVDFTWRAVGAGFKILYIRQALITHDWGGVNQEMKRALLYGQAKVKLNRKHKLGILYFLRTEYTMVFYTCFALGLPLTFWIHYYPSLILVPIFKNLKVKPITHIMFGFTYSYGALKEVFLHHGQPT